jgi:hypothetical protein
MLVDHRLYTVKAGTLSRHLEIYQQFGFEVQRAYIGEPLAFLQDHDTETGDTYVHLWVYADEADRLQKRAALQADPRWQAYLAENKKTGFLIGQTSRLMTIPAFAGSRPDVRT